MQFAAELLTGLILAMMWGMRLLAFYNLNAPNSETHQAPRAGEGWWICGPLQGRGAVGSRCRAVSQSWVHGVVDAVTRCHQMNLSSDPIRPLCLRVSSSGGVDAPVVGFSSGLATTV